jgi:hypothetical protein
MAKCQVKKGMFVLNECDHQAVGQCSECGKHVCKQHAEMEASNYICVECFAKKEFEQDPKKVKNKNHNLELDRDNFNLNSLFYYSWHSRMRDDFYTKHHHAPFNEKDYSGFEEINETEFDETNDTGGFFDS